MELVLNKYNMAETMDAILPYSPRIDQTVVSTTNATVTDLITFTIPTGEMWGIEAVIMAKRTGGASGTAGDGSIFKVVGAFTNPAGTALEVGTTNLVAVEDVAGTNITVVMSGATATLRVTGVATTNIDWSLFYKLYKV